jgi:hypothetical protein
MGTSCLWGQKASESLSNKREHSLEMDTDTPSQNKHIEKKRAHPRKERRDEGEAPGTSNGAEPNASQDRTDLLKALESLLPALKGLTGDPVPRVVTRQTLRLIALKYPTSIPDLCKIPGAISLHHFCKAAGLDLLTWVKEQG